MEECPSNDCMIFGRLRWLKSSVANVCWRLWNVKPSPLKSAVEQPLVLVAVKVTVVERLIQAVSKHEVVILPEIA